MNPQGAPAKVDARDYADLRTLNGAAYGLADGDRLVLEYIWQETYFPWQGRRTWVRLRCSDPDAPDESLLPGMSASAFGSRVTKLAELGFFDKMDPKDDANHTKCDHEHGQYWCRVHIRGMCLPVLPLPERPPKPEPEQQGPAASPADPRVPCPKCGEPCRPDRWKCVKSGCGHTFTEQERVTAKLKAEREAAQERASAEKKAARLLHVVPSPAPPEVTTVSPEPAPPMRHVTHHAAGVYHLAPRCDLDAEHVAGVRCFACLDVPDAPAPEPVAPAPRSCFLGGGQGARGNNHAPPASTPGQGREAGEAFTLDGVPSWAGGCSDAPPTRDPGNVAGAAQPAQPAAPRLLLVERGQGP